MKNSKVKRGVLPGGSTISALAIDPREFKKAQEILIGGALKNLSPEWHHLVGSMTVYSHWIDSDDKHQKIQLLPMKQPPLKKRK